MSTNFISNSLIWPKVQKMANKGISEIPLFDPIFQKMDCPLFGVTTVFQENMAVMESG